MPTLALMGSVGILVAAGFQSVDEDGNVLTPDEERVIQYSTSVGLSDPVFKLSQKLESGKVKLDYDAEKGYLPSFLKAMKVPLSSQLLVFSKTSSQAPHTSPSTPRAIYFNDQVYVGWAQNAALLDLASIDPKKGPVFYTLDQRDPKKPRIKRRNDCMSCHIGPRLLDVPALFVRSVYTDDKGNATGSVPDFISGHLNKLRDRWGGWYVTGTHGEDVHMGNTFVKEAEHPTIDLKPTSDATSLEDQLDTTKYLSRHSDTVALLVLDHAVRMQAFITRARYDALLTEDELRRAPGDARIAEWSKQRIANSGEALLAYMLFRDEAAIQGPVKGTSGYETEFARIGPRDKKGRSLREFDLITRVFKYPCSYLIHTESFDAIPKLMKDYIWMRLDQILTGKDRSGVYATMADVDRKAVLEILTDTKREFREWRSQNTAR